MKMQSFADIIGFLIAIAVFIGIISLSEYIVNHLQIANRYYKIGVGILLMFALAALAGFIYDRILEVSGKKASR